MTYFVSFAAVSRSLLRFLNTI